MTDKPLSAEDFEYSVFAMQAVKYTAMGSPYIDHDFLVKEIKSRDSDRERELVSVLKRALVWSDRTKKPRSKHGQQLYDEATETLAKLGYNDNPR